MRALLACGVLAACAHPRPVLDLRTTGELSGYVRTGHHDETIRLCHDFARAYEHVRCEVIGASGEGREIVALEIDRRPGLPVIAIQAGIHAGEIEGKDAGFAFLRDLLDGKVAPGALEAVSVVFVPTINPDGHERRSVNNRPNQRGPEEMGFRTTGARLNLNRDFTKVDAPETRAMLALIRARDPVLFVDLHTTDGAKFQHDISVVMAPGAPRGDDLDETAAALSRSLMARLTLLGHLPVPFYPSFDVETDPLSGFSIGEGPPRFAHYYQPQRNRMALLVETHSWRTYRERAQSTYHALEAVFEDATRNAAHWRAVSDAASAASTALGGTAVAMTFEPTEHTVTLPFRGYAFEVRRSDLTGGPWITYDETQPRVWTVPLHDEVRPLITITAPTGGYVIDGGYARALLPILDAHGIQYRSANLGAPVTLEAYRVTNVEYQPSYEGHQRVKLEGAWAPETRTLDQGALVIPIDQPLARLVMNLCEPTLPDSFAQWGLLNTAFEQKEYIEPYALEEAARALVAADPALKAQLDALPADPTVRLDFLYRHHPAWDERTNLIPIYRIDARAL